MANLAQVDSPAYRANAGRTVWKRLRTRRAARVLAFYAMISPWFIGFILLGIVPLVVGFITSFSNYDGINVDSVKWIGGRNYSRIFQDSEALYAFRRTLLWSALNVPLWLVASFSLALILNQGIRARGFFRTLFYLPSIIPAVGAVWAWRLLLDPNNGVVNAVISLFVPGTAILWTTDYALPSLTMISVWQGVGVGMVIFLAGLQGIPRELEEAAHLDGASKLRVFRHVTIPLMTPVIFFQLVLAIIGSLQQFALPMLLAGGRIGSVPPRAAYFFVVHVMRQIFTFSRFGYGLALMWVLFVIIVILTLLIFRSSRFWVYYEVDVAGEKR
jgi:multiple sugar transport system permease protein